MSYLTILKRLPGENKGGRSWPTCNQEYNVRQLYTFYSIVSTINCTFMSRHDTIRHVSWYWLIYFL